MFINSHGGNLTIIDLAARQLRVRHDMLAVHASWAASAIRMACSRPPSARTASMVATSKLRSCWLLYPHLVRQAKIADFRPATYQMERDNAYLRADHPAGFGWMTQDLHASGAIGDARLAAAAEG